YRGGVRVEMSKYHVTLEQGGVDFGESQTVTNSTRTTGNLTTPFLGQTLCLGNLLQQYRISGSSIFSKVLATARPASWVDLYGQFLFSQPKNDINYNASATGNFVNVSTLVFSNSMLNALTATAKQPHTTASAGAEIRPLRRLRIIESWTTNRLHDTSSTTSLPLTSQLLVWNYSQEE